MPARNDSRPIQAQATPPGQTGALFFLIFF